jgi:RNA polymerase sigma-70 factor (ECF subfamily)
VADADRDHDGSPEVAVDRRLVELAQGGDREAFARLVAIVSDRLFALAHRIVRDFDTAGDVYQSTLVLIWRELPKLRDPDRFDAWSSRILVRQCHTEFRRQRRQPPALDIATLNPSVADATISVSVRDELARAFARLTVEQRAVLVLMYYRDLSVAEIATQLDISVGTVKSRLHYAREAMRSAVDADARNPIQEGRLA